MSETEAASTEKKRLIRKWPTILLMGAVASAGFGAGMEAGELSTRTVQPIHPALLEAIYRSQHGRFNVRENNACFGGLPEVSFSRSTLLDYHNLVRQENNLRDLEIDSSLNQTAQVTAEYLAENYQKPFEHPDTPNAGIKLLEQKFDGDSGTIAIGENLAFGKAKDMAGDMRCLIESREHYKNITDRAYEFVGFGDTVAPNGLEYLVVHFASTR
jgi:uncharacterized protein YkwD